MQPLVSVIITYFNSVKLGNFVETSMNCLLNQTYKNLEFICVNDGSNDSTLQELESFAKLDSRIKVFSKENQKYAQYSKAYGQDKASGDYIFLFDHDDLISLDTIEKCVETFNRNPDLDIVTPIIKAQFTDNKLKYISNLDQIISSVDNFEFRKISGKDAIQKTVGKYDIHIRGMYRKEVFKSHSFRFSEPLLNADEIVERLIFEEARFIGSCDAVYTHYIHPDSSAKSLSPKKIDIVRTDFLLRKIFIEKGIYDNRKSIFEFTAYKNLVSAIKTFHHFSHTMHSEENVIQKKRLIDSYSQLDTKTIVSQFQGIAKIYNGILLSNFSLMSLYYKFKK
ncbi:glycosyltransferase family 2 protein [Chryseobacterium sp. FH1]|uniref:glycosyltransferase family 2 protein n=1 Tax=Chryseobacterium sp. FH1 TaxID=1233951 RepID=UPI0004E3EB27|nr:glycosyltransferase family 2 protein [Chryseobacterium sp. FH1]KFC24071.1 hypothetical protein IO90_01845 [Chryseobacterium sp. FH1]